MAFHEVRFPDNISRGARGGPERRTQIVELASGEVVLRRPGGDGEPLVRIRFSADSREYLSDARLEVAKAMIEAGIQAAAHLAGGEAELEYVGAREDGERVLH